MGGCAYWRIGVLARAPRSGCIPSFDGTVPLCFMGMGFVCVPVCVSMGMYGYVCVDRGGQVQVRSVRVAMVAVDGLGFHP
jgi:hypothetical protein